MKKSVLLVQGTPCTPEPRHFGVQDLSWTFSIKKLEYREIFFYIGNSAIGFLNDLWMSRPQRF